MTLSGRPGDGPEECEVPLEYDDEDETSCSAVDLVVVGLVEEVVVITVVVEDLGDVEPSG